jgi:hypothetical protein
MSNHPITLPPDDMVQQWRDTWADKKFCCEMDDYIAVRAALWGADQQLEACCEQLKSIPSPLGIPFGEMASNALRNACRPNPPTLKEQALSELNLTADPDGAELSRTQVELIREALESL